MSYKPNLRNTSGIVFFGEQGSQPTYYSDSNFLIEDGAAGNIQAPNLKISDGGNIGSVSDPDAIAIAANGNVTLSKSLSVTGDLTVNGTTTTVDSTVVTIEDPVIIIGAQAGDNPYGSTTDDNKDRGISFFWNDGTGPSIGFFGHDDSRKGFVYVSSGTFDATSGVITGDPGWAVFAGVSGALAGNATTATDATNVTVTANNTTNETVYLAFVDGATGSQGIETDTALSYNPSTDTLTAGTFNGNLTGNVTGNADTATSAAALTNERYIGVSGQVVGSGAFDGSADVVVNTDLTLEAIRDQTEKGSAAVAADYILLMDSEDSDNLKKISRSNLISGLGGFSNFTVSDRVTTGTVDDGEQLIFTDGPTINFTIAAEGSNHTVSGVVVDNSIDENKLTTSVAGLGIAGGNGTALSFAPSELTDTAIANGDSLVFMDATDSNAPKVEALADIATLFAGVGLSASNSVLAVNAGVGLVANGDNIDVDLSEFNAVALASGDSFATLDSDGSAEQRTTIMDLGAYLAGGTGSNIVVNGSGQLFAQASSSFTITDGSTPQVIEDGDTITFSDSTRINFSTSATDTVSADLIANTVSETYLTTSVAGAGLSGGNGTALAVDISEFSTVAVGAGDSFLVLDNDGSTEQRATVDQLGTYLAGDNITNTAGVLSVADSDIEAAIFTDANFTDGTTVNFTVSAGASVTAEVQAIDTTHFNATALVTEGEGIGSNDNDTTIPTSAAVKDYVDNVAVKTVVTDSTTSAILSSEDVSLADASGGSITLTLPTHSSGKVVTVKKTDSSGNTVTVTGATGNVDGASNVILYSQNESVTVISDGANWFII